MISTLWLLLTLIRLATTPHLNFLYFFMNPAERAHDFGISFIESHPSSWNWFFEALLLGGDDLRNQETLQSFFTLGIYHILVGAGGHVVVLEKIIKKFLYFLSPNSQRLILGFLLGAFCFLNRLGPSCVRALVVWILREWVTDKRWILNRGDLQWVATCICLLIQPQWASSVGFALACAASLGLVIVSSLEIKKRAFQKLGAALGCVLCTGPLMLGIQPCLSWLIIPANMLALPVFSFIFIPLSLLSVVFIPLKSFTEGLLSSLFSFTDFFLRFKEPIVCFNERNFRSWGLIYLSAVYCLWRWCLPYYRRRRFRQENLVDL